MLNKLLNHIDLPARAALSAIFILSGLSKVSAFAQTQGYMEAFGISGVLLTPTILVEVGAGLALLAGFQTRVVALLLASFTLVTALVFHTNFADQIQEIVFLENMSMAGGLLLLAKVGTSGLSVDAFIQSRNEVSP